MPSTTDSSSEVAAERRRRRGRRPARSRDRRSCRAGRRNATSPGWPSRSCTSIDRERHPNPSPSVLLVEQLRGLRLRRAARAPARRRWSASGGARGRPRPGPASSRATARSPARPPGSCAARSRTARASRRRSPRPRGASPTVVSSASWSIRADSSSRALGDLVLQRHAALLLVRLLDDPVALGARLREQLLAVLHDPARLLDLLGERLLHLVEHLEDLVAADQHRRGQRHRLRLVHDLLELREPAGEVHQAAPSRSTSGLADVRRGRAPRRRRRAAPPL